MRRGIALILLSVGLAASPGSPWAREAPALASDPALEARTLAIAQELRCLVCQNETIAASHADLALDLRQQIREQLSAGRTPEQIRDYMVARYGEFVLYRPRFEIKTWLLWMGPFVLLLLAFGMLWRTLRRRTPAPDEADTLTPEEHERAHTLLAPGDPHP